MELPFASIIIPVLNAEDIITDVLRAVQEQTYPTENYEILVVDNGSADSTKTKVTNIKDVLLLEEAKIQNPYVARNKGLRQAKGDVLVLLDANCTPAPYWLESGIKRLMRDDVDLTGGQVVFTFSDEETLGEWYDSLLFVDMEDLIRRGNSCAGGNLFFSRSVLDTIGLFPEGQRSGMDLYWTKKATDNDFNLVYEPQAKVTYPARRLGALLKKVFRVGTGQPKTWLDDGRHPLKMMAAICYQFIPGGTKKLKKKIERRGKPEMYDRIGALWCIQYLQQITLAAGWTKGFISYYID